MNVTLKAGLASAALAVAASATSVMAADLGRGSIKDGYEPAPMAHVQRGPAGNCYFRGDVGYSASRNPSAKWAVTNFDRTYDGADLASSTSFIDRTRLHRELRDDEPSKITAVRVVHPAIGNDDSDNTIRPSKGSPAANGQLCRTIVHRAFLDSSSRADDRPHRLWVLLGHR